MSVPHRKDVLASVSHVGGGECSFGCEDCPFDHLPSDHHTLSMIGHSSESECVDKKFNESILKRGTEEFRSSVSIYLSYNRLGHVGQIPVYQSAVSRLSAG